MNIELTNHKEKMIISKDIIDIFRIVMEAQNEGRCTSFIDISGHCEQLQVRFFVPVWSVHMEPTFSEYIYIQEEEGRREYITEFKQRIINFLLPLPTNAQ